MARTFYKLLILALALLALGVVLGAANQISAILAQTRSGFGNPLAAATGVLLLCGRTLLPIVALYWVPKVVHQMFPEVR